MSVLRSPRYPPRYGERWELGKGEPVDQGHHIADYLVYVHKGNWKESNTVQLAYEFNYPLIIHLEEIHEGKLPKEHSFIEIEPRNVILTVLKKAEEGDDIIIRFYETYGEKVNVKVKLHRDIKEAYEVDLIERSIRKIQTNEKILEEEIKPYEIKSYKIKF